jgi:hypothetical protein
MAFNFNVFSSGGGFNSINGITKYATVSALPGVANDGDLAITLDTDNIYAFNTGTNSWILIGGSVTLSVSDTNSIDFTLAASVLSGVVRIVPGSTGLPANTQGVSLLVYAGASPGLVGYIPAGTISEVTSSVLQFSGPGKAVGFSLGIQVNQATGSTPGYISAADYTRFATGISAQLNTQFPVLGGGLLSSGLTLSVPVANGSTGGYLSATDWTTFNNKLPTGATIAQLGNIAANTFLGNNTGSPGAILALTIAQTKTALGLTLTNSGDVTIGSVLTPSIAAGATISAAQVLQLTGADATNAGLMLAVGQSFAGDKIFGGFVQTNTYLKLGGGSMISIGASNVTTGYTLFMPSVQGGTYTSLANDGRGNLSWSYAEVGFYRSVSSGATLLVQERFLEVTTGAGDQTTNIGWGTGNTGVIFTIQKVDSGLGQVIVQSDRLINGTTNFVFGSQWEAHEFVDNGVGIRVIN